jgi:hypothetical protein
MYQNHTHKVTIPVIIDDFENQEYHQWKHNHPNRDMRQDKTGEDRECKAPNAQFIRYTESAKEWRQQIHH